MMSVPQMPQLVADVAPLRLTLKSIAPITGYVDGGWWPHSRDLGAEAGDLARAVTLRLGPVCEIAYALDTWELAPARVAIDSTSQGSWVRLVGFASQDPHVVLVTGQSGRTLGLLVVPPEAPEAAGHAAMNRAARADNEESPTALLAAAGVPPVLRIPAPRRPRDAAPCRTSP
jgi:hypothetical protein